MAIISKYNNQSNDDLVNEKIRFKEVLVIDQNGDQLGVMSRNQAINVAYDQDLDLVCVAPKAKTPVCRIMDYGKYRFEQQKKQKEMKKNSKTVSLKETQLSPTIDVHDFETRVRNAKEYLIKGHRIKAFIRFKGRQMARPELGEEVLLRFAESLSEVSMIEAKPKLDGRQMFMLLAPKK